MPKVKEKESESVAHAKDGGTIADASEAALQARIDKVKAKLDEIDDILHDAVELTDEQRLTAHRLRGDQEQAALSGVLDYADQNPMFFKGLANKDGGHDPGKFETDLLRHRLANAAALTKLVERFDETRLAIADSALYVASLVKPPILAAYEIAKPLAKNDEAHGQKLNPALNYFGAVARAGVKTRQARKTEKASGK